MDGNQRRIFSKGRIAINGDCRVWEKITQGFIKFVKFIKFISGKVGYIHEIL
jgi:hypothetical protein